MTLDTLLRILDIIIWPVVVGALVYSFRGVFQYLVLSLEEFNFLGTKGKIRSVTEVIDDQVKQRLAEKNRQEEEERLRGELDKHKNDNEEIKKFASALIDERKDLLQENEELREEKEELQKQSEQVSKSLEDTEKLINDAVDEKLKDWTEKSRPGQ